MTPIKLKAEAGERVIGYNNSSKPLGQREDHAELLKEAYAADRQDYLDLFEEYPTREELLGAEAERKIGAIDNLVLPVLPALPALPETLEVPVLTPEEQAVFDAEVAGLRAQAQADAPVLPAVAVDAEKATTKENK